MNGKLAMDSRRDLVVSKIMIRGMTIDYNSLTMETNYGIVTMFLKFQLTLV